MYGTHLLWNQHASTYRRRQARRRPASAEDVFSKSSRAILGTEAKRQNESLACFVIGNSYAHVLHAHLLYPVSVEITRRLAQLGQNNMMTTNFSSGIIPSIDRPYLW